MNKLTSKCVFDSTSLSMATITYIFVRCSLYIFFREHFAAVPSGMGFDNLGQIFQEDEPFRTEKALCFETRDVVHLILDFSQSSRWRLYAKVGDLDEEDYDDLSAAEEADKLTAVFDHVQPGSYRLAVSLFSPMDALIIESCKIHGVEDAEFFQELKQYALTEEAEEEETVEVVPVENEDADTNQELPATGLLVLYF